MEERNEFKEQCLKKRWSRVLKFTSKKFGINTKEHLLFYLSVIPDDSRKVFEARWGLDNGIDCYRFESLSQKIGMEKQDCLELYKKAETDLINAKYAMLMKNHKNAFSFEVASRYGKLAKAAYPNLLPDMLDIHCLIKIVDTKLGKLQKNVICMRFGLIDGQQLTLEAVGHKLNYSIVWAQKTQNDALKTLQKEIEKAINPSKPIDYKDSDSFELLELSVRTRNCLKRAGYRTVGDFKKISKDQIIKIRNLGKKSYEEICTKRAALGVPVL